MVKLKKIKFELKKIIKLCIEKRRHDTKHIGIQHNDMQHNDTQHNDIQRSIE